LNLDCVGPNPKFFFACSRTCLWPEFLFLKDFQSNLFSSYALRPGPAQTSRVRVAPEAFPDAIAPPVLFFLFGLGFGGLESSSESTPPAAPCSRLFFPAIKARRTVFLFTVSVCVPLVLSYFSVRVFRLKYAAGFPSSFSRKRAAVFVLSVLPKVLPRAAGLVP
jgi:hypothetical protein